MNKFDIEEQIAEPDVHSVDQNSDAYIDYRKLHYKNTMLDNRILVFLTGFCIGMVFFYLSGGQNASGKSLLDREHLLLMQSFDINQTGFLMYTLGLRVRQLLFMVICALSSIGGLLAYSIMGWYGFEVGLMIFFAGISIWSKGNIFDIFYVFATWYILLHCVFNCISQVLVK